VPLLHGMRTRNKRTICWWKRRTTLWRLRRRGRSAGVSRAGRVACRLGRGAGRISCHIKSLIERLKGGGVEEIFGPRIDGRGRGNGDLYVDAAEAAGSAGGDADWVGIPVGADWSTRMKNRLKAMEGEGVVREERSFEL